MSTYTAVAYCPHTGLALRQGDKSFYLSPDGRLKEMFKLFPESAVLKHHYMPIKEVTGTVQELQRLMAMLDQKVGL